MTEVDERLSNELDKIFTILIKVLLLSLATFFLLLGLKWFYIPIYVYPEPVIITVEKGTTSANLARALEGEGFKLSPVNFRVLSTLMMADKSLKAGEYTITNTTTLYELINMIKKGDVNKYNLTIIEGSTINDLLRVLANSNSIKLTAGLGSSESIGILRIGIEERNFEGLLLPDTYQYQGGESDINIISRAHRHMQEFLKEAWNSRSSNLPIKTPYEALILASIVEKEARLRQEMPKIAAVYHERLRRNWRLQADPTVNYALGGDYGHSLTREDLKLDSVFNTYTRKGLPPSPIAFPSRDAINAVLHPDPEPSLYFVANGSGGHIFSKSYEEHVKAVKAYRLIKR